MKIKKHKFQLNHHKLRFYTKKKFFQKKYKNTFNNKINFLD